MQVTTHHKALFARAAQLSDQTLTDFIIAAVNAAAARVVRDHEVMSLSAEDSAAFAAALLRPAASGRHLRKAAVRQKGRVALCKTEKVDRRNAWDVESSLYMNFALTGPKLHTESPAARSEVRGAPSRDRKKVKKRKGKKTQDGHGTEREDGFAAGEAPQED